MGTQRRAGGLWGGQAVLPARGWSCAPLPGSLPAEAQRSGENSSQSCDVPGFLKMGWSAKQLPVVRNAPRRALSILLPPHPRPSHRAVPAPCTGRTPRGTGGCHRPPRTEPSRAPCPAAAPQHPSLLVQLNPILPDLEYLGDQHLLLSIKGVESCESYGACGMGARAGCCCARGGGGLAGPPEPPH